jgi:hypothetical protein
MIFMIKKKVLFLGKPEKKNLAKSKQKVAFSRK